MGKQLGIKTSQFYITKSELKSYSEHFSETNYHVIGLRNVVL